jgi:hypothetical protein
MNLKALKLWFRRFFFGAKNLLNQAETRLLVARTVGYQLISVFLDRRNNQ